MAVYAGFWGPEALLWSTSGTPVRDTPVTVLDADTLLPTTLYTTEQKAVVAPNPTKTDSTGNLSFFAVPGEYVLAWDGVEGHFVVVVPHPDDPDEGGGGGGITDHGLLTGLGDDDHTQYHTDARGDARYFTQAQVTSSLAGKQPLDADLTAIAGLTPSNDDVVQRKSGAWTNRTPTQLKTDLAIGISDVSGLQAALDALPRLAATTQAGTAYTLALGDAGTAVELTSGSAVGVTVPPNSGVAFPVGTVVELVQAGAGQVTITPGGGVTVRTASSLTSRAQWSVLCLRKRATDEWIASGDLT